MEMLLIVIKLRSPELFWPKGVAMLPILWIAVLTLTRISGG
jgi:hypothetical protein